MKNKDKDKVTYLYPAEPYKSIFDEQNGSGSLKTIWKEFWEEHRETIIKGTIEVITTLASLALFGAGLILMAALVILFGKTIFRLFGLM